MLDVKDDVSALPKAASELSFDDELPELRENRDEL
jgi:hypothetical protein